MSFWIMQWQRLGTFRAARRERQGVRRSPYRPQLRFRPWLEALEERALLSTFVVTNLNDSGTGSLRAVVQAADATSGATINFANNLSGTITLTSGVLDLTSNMTINGPGANTIAVSGNHSSGVFEVASGANVSLKDLSILDGNSGLGGGIDNSGSLMVSDCTLSGNSAGFGGGGTFNDNAAGLTIRGSTLSGNSAGYDGGGIYNQDGTVTVSNCSVTRNTATSGGGIYTTGGTLSLLGNNNISNNHPDNIVYG